MNPIFLHTSLKISKNKNPLLFRITFTLDDSILLRNNVMVFPHIIKLTDTSMDPVYFVDTTLHSLLPAEHGSPTLKIMLPTLNNFKTREYLPILPFNKNIFNEFKELSWITTTSLSPPNHPISILSPTLPIKFTKFTCFFVWKTDIHPLQLTIPSTLPNSPRKRSWSIKNGKSSLYEPIKEQTDINVHTQPRPIPPFTQAYTMDLSIEYLKKEIRLFHILEKGRTTQPPDPLWQNLYIRFQGPVLKKYFVLRQHPTANGITINYKDHSLYFAQIRPLSGPALRFIYKQLSSFRSPYDWLPIGNNDFHLLTKYIPHIIHSKLSDLL